MVVELRVAEDIQNEVIATHALEAGTCVLIEEPFADLTTLTTCARCYRPINRSAILNRRKPCLKCNQVMYCTKKCKVAHEDVHEAYCEAFKMGSAHHRKLTKSQEHLAVLTAQCISRVFMEAEREGICGVHALFNGCKDSPIAPERWLYDYAICKILYYGGLPPVNPGQIDLSSMLRRAGEPELPLDQLGTVKDFLLLTKQCDNDGKASVGLPDEALEASLNICNSILRRWTCTCNSKWSDSASAKRQIIENVMQVILNHGIFTEVRWPNEWISTQMSEILPTHMINYSLAKPEPEPLDRRKSGLVDDNNNNSTRLSDRYLPSIAGFNTLGAYGLWPRLSLLTHSCVPNCYVYWVKNRAVVVTLRAIPEGERLTIAKCSLLLPYQCRAQILKTRYNFTCGCDRCVSRGQLTLQDIDSISRDLAPIIPDETIISNLNTDSLSYLNVDFGLTATKHLQPLCLFEPADYAVTDRRYQPKENGIANTNAANTAAANTPETMESFRDDRCLSFKEGGMLRLPTLPTDGNQNPEVLVANCEISLFNNLMSTLRHQTSDQSFGALCDVTAAALENRLNPLSIHLYELRRELIARDWRAAAKQLVFFSFIYRHCEGHLDRIEILERLGLLLKKDYYSKRLSIGGRRKRSAPLARVNYAATMSTTAETCSVGGNPSTGTPTNYSHPGIRSFEQGGGGCYTATTQVTPTPLLLPKEAARPNDKEVITEVLRCIFREVQYGYQNLFGPDFARTKQASAILTDLTK